MLKKTIKQLQKVKMNYLHLHLTDDEGWRIEIPALKELTEFGAYRCANTEECLEPQYGSGQSKDSVANGFISAAEYEDLLGFAKVSFKVRLTLIGKFPGIGQTDFWEIHPKKKFSR